jgi:hypothetical protein
MEFLQKWLFRHAHSPAGSHADDGRPPRRHDDHGGHAPRPPRDASYGDPRYAQASGHEHGESHAPRHDARHRSPLSGVLRALAQHKTLVGVAALLLLVVAVGGVLGLVRFLPLAGTLAAGVAAPDLSALLTDLPRLVSMLLVDMPKAVLDYLAPVLQLKTALEGKG